MFSRSYKCLLTELGWKHPGLDSYSSTPSVLSHCLPQDPRHLGSGSSVESTEEHEDSVTNKDMAGHHAKHMLTVRFLQNLLR